MPLPPKLFHPIGEVAHRWSVAPIDIIGWAIAERIALSAALPLVEVGRGTPVEGLVEIPGQDILDLFAGGSDQKAIVRVRRFRRRLRGRWERIVAPADGVPLRSSAVVIARTEVERFEREHRLFGQTSECDTGGSSRAASGLHGQAGAPSRYDWNAFAGAVARRIHDEGLPASQGELVRDMLDWFAASGAAPDESTVRRRVQAMWPALMGRG